MRTLVRSVIKYRRRPRCLLLYNVYSHVIISACKNVNMFWDVYNYYGAIIVCYKF